METRAFGQAGPFVPVIGQGTWEMEKTPTESIAALRAGLDLGMTHIDTAEMYGDGEAEMLVGEAIAGRRDAVFLVSKVLPENASFAGTAAACEHSLRRLGTDRLDAYLLHWPGRHPLEDTIAAFEKLKSEGKILAYGISNFDAAGVDRAVSIAGRGRIACNQVFYHLGERDIEHSVIPACKRHGIAVVAYTPFGQSKFPKPGSPGGRILAEIAAKHGATPHQVTLRFLVRNPFVFAIPKASRIDHVRENAGAGDLRLDAEDLRRLDAAFPLPRPKRRLPMV